MKIAVFSSHKFELPYLSDVLSKYHTLKITEQELNENSFNFAASCDAVSLFTSDKADSAILEKLAALGIKYIALRSVGFDHVDLKKAKELNIKVTNVPAYSPYAVAEHAVTLLMALNRKLLLSQKLIGLNDFRLDNLTGIDIHGKTVGIIGLGKIGEAFAQIMKGFGCELLCYDPHAKPDLKNELKIKFIPLEELCRKSDIISIHCPLNSDTKYLFNSSTFSLMKKGVFIINTARGSIIKTADVLLALESGLIGGLGLDVYEFEKGLFFHDHTKDGLCDKTLQKLRSYPNVLITAHQAFLTKTALQNIADTTLDNLNCLEKGTKCKNTL
ncbi:MAG: 2-hydroxyacid dehydrogenase [Bacteroidia bacterium]